jgi:hypothetical protein
LWKRVYITLVISILKWDGFKINFGRNMDKLRMFENKALIKLAGRERDRLEEVVH